MFYKTTAPKRSHATSPAAADDWLALVDRISNQEQDALAEFYDLTKRQVFGLLLRILNDEGAAEEVLLDVYMQVWRQARHYDVKRGAPQAWVTTIARSRAIDRLRSGKHEVKLKEPLDLSRIASIAHEGVDLVTDSERRKYVGDALDALPGEQREVIELAYFQGLSQTEIALKLAQPLGTVKTRTRLGLAKLRDSLKPLVEGAL
jgi:RNA polymerase sigma-70 factor (ECF subfamily)